jgi:hypothetical protein
MLEDDPPNAEQDAKGRSKNPKGKHKPGEGESPHRASQEGAKGREARRSGLNASPQFSLLSFSGPIETVSNLPGRTRFRAKAVIGREDARDLLVKNLPRIKGVDSVEVNVVSGSVLINYQPDAIIPEILFAALIKLLDLEDEFLSPPEPFLARELREVASSLNRTVYELTCGFTDLHTLLMTALIVYGVYAIRRDALQAFPGGLTLLWWAYSSLFASE